MNQKVSILIPTRQRYEKLRRCISSILENTEYPEYEIVVIVDFDDPGSVACIDFPNPRVKLICHNRREMYVGKINLGYHRTKSPFVVYLADDVIVRKGWLTEAMKVMKDELNGLGLVSFNDWHYQERLAPHGLISRKFVRAYLNNDIFYPGYVHYWCDTELTVRAKSWKRFAYSPKSFVEHTREDRPEDRDHLCKEGEKTRQSGADLFTLRQWLEFPDEMPEPKREDKLPEKVKLRFHPTERVTFYRGFFDTKGRKIDTREGRKVWEVNTDTAILLLRNFPVNWKPASEIRKKPKKRDLRILACLCVYNEIDILPYLLKYLTSQGIEVFVFDNFSTDGTWEYLNDLHYRCERLDTGGEFNLKAILDKKMELFHREKPDWCIYQDADEFILTSEFKTLKEFITDRDRKGYTVINQLRVFFLPTGEENYELGDPRKVFRYYDRGCWFDTPNACSDRIFKYSEDMVILEGAHHVITGDYRVSREGLDNPIFHYPYREFREQKIRERRERSKKEYSEKNLHRHYYEFIPEKWDKKNLTDIRDPENPLYKFYTGKAIISLEDLVGKGRYNNEPHRDMQPFFFFFAGLVIACDAKLVFEIGTGYLRSTKSFLWGLEKTGGRLVSCDPVKRWDSFSHPQFKFIQKKSSEVLEDWKDEIDLLFIDGDHSLEAARFDLEKFGRFVRKGGLIVLHDTSYHDGPRRVVSESKFGDMGMIYFQKIPGLTIYQKVK